MYCKRIVCGATGTNTLPEYRSVYLFLVWFVIAPLISSSFSQYVDCQELLTLPEHLSSPWFLVGFVLLDHQFYMYVLLIVVCPFVLFLLAIVLCVLLRYTDSDCAFGISKLFLNSTTMRYRKHQCCNLARMFNLLLYLSGVHV